MKQSHVDKVVEAALYEGYTLYPYRPSSTKNQERFTFGCVYPMAYSQAQRGAEPCVMQSQCLVEGAAPMLQVSVRFLHPLMRTVGRLSAPLPSWPEKGEPAFDIVPELRVGEAIYQTWQEALEREVRAPSRSVEELVDQAQDVPFSFPASRELEPIRDEERVVGVIVRRQEALEGAVHLSAERVSNRVYRIIVRILNRTPVPEDALDDQEAITARLFASTHTILQVDNGAFLSLMDPPAEHAEAAAACENDGTWPVLIGEDGERDTMLSSPIILYDYPEVAPESPGTLFDSTEIDELLTLRIMTMTDEEKREMRQADARTRQVLERTEALPDEHLQKLHGAIRNLRPLDGDGFFDERTSLEQVTVGGATYRTGDRVWIHPKRRADIMDLALEGKRAVIEAIEQDYENQVYLALVLDEDPGQDLGRMRQPGHRFFFAPDEVERLQGDER